MSILRIGLLCTALALCGCASASNTNTNTPNAGGAPLALASEGTTAYRIVRPAQPSPVDQYTIRTLGDYLTRITGAEFDVIDPAAVTDDGKYIFVGLSGPARARLGGDPVAELNEQQYVVRSKDADIFLFGEGIHGNLNASMDFLEDSLGWRWYAVHHEPITPSKPNATLAPMNRTRGFDFVSREIPARWGNDFYYQHHVNQGFYRRQIEWTGDAIDVPAPEYASYLPSTNFVHSAFSYIPPNPDNHYADHFGWLKKRNYFETNPEFFTLSAQGERVPDKQLCFSNDKLRAEFTRNVMRDIKHNGPRVLITVDAADTPGKFCHCEPCQALEAKYQSPGGPMYDYIFELCETLEEKHPQAYVRTLAYRRSQTQEPPVLPAGEMLPENMVVAFAPIEDNYFADWTHPDAQIQDTYSDLKAWGAIAHHLWAWIYPNPWGSGNMLPVGNVDRLITNIRMMHDAGVTGLFADHNGYLHRSNWAELQAYLMFKLMQDVDADTDAIIKAFTEHHYGDAAPLVRQYLYELEQARKAMKDLPYGVTYKSTLYNERVFPYLTPENIHHWQQYCDWMLEMARDGTYEQDNVRLLRRELDFAALVNWFEMQEYKPDYYQDYQAFIARIRSANNITSPRGTDLARKLGQSKLADLERRLQAGGKEKPLPAQFDGIDRDRIRTFMPTTKRNRTQPVDDADAAFGYATVVHQPRLPFKGGYCEFISRRHPRKLKRTAEIEIDLDRITPGEYKLYEMGTFEIGGSDALIWFGRSWATHLQVGKRLYMPGVANRWKAYVSLKFDGPTYGGDADTEDQVRISRLILVKASDDQGNAH